MAVLRLTWDEYDMYIRDNQEELDFSELHMMAFEDYVEIFLDADDIEVIDNG